MLSVIILTHNNQVGLKKALQSVGFSDEIIIIDDFSTDKTLEIIKKLNNSKIKIFKRKLGNDFAAQRNFGLQKARSKWVLFLDGDEYLSQDIQTEIAKFIKSANNQNIQGVYIRRQDRFFGKKLKYGETGNVKLLRLAQKNMGKWVGKVHETWQISGQIKKLNNPIIHERNFTIKQFLQRLNWYSSLQAEEFYKNRRKEPLLAIVILPICKFLQNYILKLGFWDGFEGFLMAVFMSWHSLLVRIKLREKWNSG
jgi:glycosyltransferase involved in cell wall biosynthesis